MREYSVIDLNKLIATANKRITRLRAAGAHPQSLKAVEKYFKDVSRDVNKKFTIKGKKGKELETEIKHVETFMRSKTSTLTGIKKQSQKIFNTLGKKYDISAKQAVKLIDLFNDVNYKKIKDIIPSDFIVSAYINNNYNTDFLQQLQNENFDSVDDLIDYITHEIL